MEIDSSGWTNEMRNNAVRKLEDLGYREEENDNAIGVLSISVYTDNSFILFDHAPANVRDRYDYIESLTTYEQLIAMTQEDVK